MDVIDVDELQHSLLSNAGKKVVSALKGIERKGHKYIKREGTSGNYRYFYKNTNESKKSDGDSKAERLGVNDALVKEDNYDGKIVSAKKTGWLKKGEEKEGHKWIRRFGTPGNYTYIYEDGHIEKDGDAKSLDDFERISNPLPDVNPPMDALEEDIQEINDGGLVSAMDSEATFNGRHTNCYACTLAYEMRRRGYDVQAKRDPYYEYEQFFTTYRDVDGGASIYSDEKLASMGYESGKNRHGIQEFYKGEPEFDTAFSVNVYNPSSYKLSDSSYEKFESSVRDMGNGARGTVVISYAGTNSGHSMAFEIIDNEVCVIDGQTGQVFRGKDEIMSKDCPMIHADSCQTLRTDNLEINENVATKFVEPSSEGGYNKRTYKEDTTERPKATYENFPENILQDLATAPLDARSSGFNFVKDVIEAYSRKKEERKE